MVNANEMGIQAILRFLPNPTDSKAPSSFSSPLDEFKISQSSSKVVKTILPQFPSHPGIQESLGRKSNIEHRHPAWAQGAFRFRPQTRRLAGGHHLLLDCKETINNHWKSYNKLFYENPLIVTEFSMTRTPLPLA